MARPVGNLLSFLRFLNKRENIPLNINFVEDYLSCSRDCLIGYLDLLKDNGFKILLKGDEITLLNKVDLLDKERIYREVKGRGRIDVIDVVGSTNNELLQRAFNIASGDSLLTEIQTAGRGQQGIGWRSGIAQQLCLSMGWIFSSLEKIQGLSIAVGVEIARELSKRGLDVQNKWPNDLFLNGLKLGGILVETLNYKDKIVVVIGVGLNVHHTEFSNLSRKVAFLDDVKAFSRNESAIIVLNALKLACSTISYRSFSFYPKSIVQYDYLLGKEITIITPQGKVVGISRGVSEKGELLLENSQGLTKISSGHVIL